MSMRIEELQLDRTVAGKEGEKIDFWADAGRVSEVGLVELVDKSGLADSAVTNE